MTDALQAADSDGLSAEEAAFFESRGEKAEGLVEKPEVKEEVKEGTKDVKAEAKADDVKMEPDEAEETVELENKGRFVRHGAFHKERSLRKQEQEARRALETRLSEKEQAFARVDERLKLLNEALAKPEPKPDAPPDPEQDIFGYVKWQAKQIEELKGKTTEASKINEDARAHMVMATTYRRDASSFAEKQADFGDAYQFLMKGRDAELQAYGISDPQERARVILDEERNLVQRAIHDQASPAERVYALAKARGYVKAEEKKPDAAEKIETIARGQSASKTLSNAGGSPSETLTAEALANMSEEEFAAFLAKTPKSQARALMGG